MILIKRAPCPQTRHRNLVFTRDDFKAVMAVEVILNGQKFDA
jgi:hypothetical protein